MLEENDLEKSYDDLSLSRKGSSDIKVSFRLKKLHLLLAGIIVFLVVVGLLVWKFNLIKKTYDWYYRADVAITVVDKTTNKPLSAAVKVVNKDKSGYQASGITDQNGKFSASHLIKGAYSVSLVADGYINVDETASLSKGANNVFSYKMEVIPPKQATLSGSVLNYVNEAGLSDIAVIFGDKNAKTDASGNFSISELNLGTYTLKVERSGYLSYAQPIEIKEQDKKLDPIQLVPEGRVVFISNRDGKRGVYTSNYDGSDQKALVARIGDYEDYMPTLSPNGQKVLFMSTRQGNRKNGVLIENLFVADLDGKNLEKISDLPGGYGAQWSGNSKKIIWQSYADNKNQLYVYDISGKTNDQIEPDKSVQDLKLSSDGTKMAYSVRDQNNSASRSIFIRNIDSNTVTNTVLENSTKGIYIVDFRGSDELIYSYYDDAAKSSKYINYNLNTQVTADTQYDYATRSYVFSHDKKHKAFIENRDGKNNVYLVDGNNGNENKLTAIDTAQSPVYWSLDDKIIFFNSTKTGENALYLISLDGAKPKKIVDISYEGYGYGQ